MRNLRGWVAAVTALFVVVGLAPGARASLLLAMDLRALTARADHVVVGEVVAVTSEWSADHRRIYSRIDLDVVETWRSTAARSIARVSIWQVGGQVDELELIVSGMPRFEVGERAVLFLKGAPERARVVGGALGKLPVHRDDARAEPLVWAPRLGGATTLAPRGAALVPARPTALSVFRAQVESAAAGRTP